MKKLKDVRETTTGNPILPQWLHKIVMKPKLKNMVRMYLNWRRKNPGQGTAGVQQVVKMMGLSPRDGNLLIDTLNDLVKQGKMPKHLALESTDRWYKDQPEWGTPESTKKAKEMTPGQKEAKELKVVKTARKLGVGKNDDFYRKHMNPERLKKMDQDKKRPAPMKVKKPVGSFKWFQTRDMKND